MIKTILKLILLIYFINSVSCVRKPEPGFKDDIGNIVSVTHPVKRIISLAPNISEIMFFLNKGNLLKGVTKLCNYPLSVKKINKVGGMLNPDMEKIIKLRPDLVLISYEGNNLRIYKSLKTLKIPVYTVKINSITTLFSSLERLSKFLKSGKSIKNKITAYKKRLLNLKNTLTGKRLFFHIGGIRRVYSFGKNTLVDEITELTGAINTASAGQSRFPVFNKETLSGIKPDYIILLEGHTGETKTRIKRFWKSINKKAILIDVNPDTILRPGPRIIEGFENLRRKLCGK